MEAEDIKREINKIETSEGCNINSVQLTSDLGSKIIQNLIAAELKEVKKGSPENPYIVCGTCEKPMKLFNVEFKKWYCFTCRKYANN